MLSDIKESGHVERIPISAIVVENPRERSEKTFRALIDSIAKVGLKKPITVAKVAGETGDTYRLVCGQGRMEACMALGETEVPAIIVEANEVERLLRSVVENVARRSQKPLELLQDIAILRDRGYSDHQIADKTGLSFFYVHEIGELIANGEERLLIAVESGQMPLSVALYISRAQETDVQKALEAAYESGELRGKKLLEARRLVELRQRHGRHKGPVRQGQPPVRMTSAVLVRAYRGEVERQQDMVRRAQSMRGSLLFLDAAFQQLLKDDNFLTLLRAEGLESLPHMVVAGLQEPRA